MRSEDRTRKEDAEDSAAVEELIDDLRGDTVDQPGVFTIDRAEAHRRMQRYQLPDKALYVLDLVQLAVCKGAHTIEIHAEDRLLRLSFDGSPITLDDAERAHSALFLATDSGNRDARARAHLALALGKALDRAERMEITSGDGEQGIRLVLHSGPEEVLVEEGLGPNTQIELRYSDGPPDRELALLRERVRYCHKRVLLDGEALNHGFILPQALEKFGLNTANLRCTVGLEIRHIGGRMLLIADGVLLTEHDFQKTFPGCVALLDVSTLRRDLSRWDVVRDEAYEELVAGVRSVVEKLSEHTDLRKRRQEAHRVWVAQAMNRWFGELVRGRRKRLTILNIFCGVVALLVAAGAYYLVHGVIGIPFSEAEGYIVVGVLVVGGGVASALSKWASRYFPGDWMAAQALALDETFHHPEEPDLIKSWLDEADVHVKAQKELRRLL